MPRGSWSPKRERQYEHILESCMARGKRLLYPRGPCALKRKKRCQRIAAATVNRDRTRACETKACRASRRS